jgi:hypothetical protein
MVNALASMLHVNAPVLKGNPDGGSWFNVDDANGYTGRTTFVEDQPINNPKWRCAA